MLATRTLLSNRLEKRMAAYTLRLREDFLRDMETKRGAVFAQEAEIEGTGADVAKLEEEGIDTSIQLGEVFNQKDRVSRSARDESGTVS